MNAGCAEGSRVAMGGPCLMISSAFVYLNASVSVCACLLLALGNTVLLYVDECGTGLAI